ncbi:MAG: hypothetical protein ACFE9D_06760 [Promethearchaeota archaeon]
MKKKLLPKLFLVTFALAILFVSSNLAATQNSRFQATFSKAPLGASSYNEYFTSTTYEDVGQTTADGWGDGALSMDRDLTVTHLSTYTTSYVTPDIAVQGRKAYIAVLTWSGSNSQTARTLNVTDPTAMTLMGWRNIAQDVQSVAIHGDMLYVGRQNWVIQYNVSNPYGAYINQGAVAVVGNVTDLAVHGHFLHAVAQTTSGNDHQYIIDIENPISMSIVSDSPWSDAWGLDVQGELAYLADGTFGMYIRNVSNPYAPLGVDSYNTPGTAKDVLVDGGIAYIADGSAGVTILNVSDPTNITYLGSIDTYDARELALQGNTLFVADFTGGVKIIDVTNPQHPVFVYQITGTTYSIAISGEILYVGLPTGMASYAVTMYSVIGPGLPWFNRYNAYDAWDVAIQGNIAYVAGGTDGFYTLDITNPRNPVLLDRTQHLGSVNYYSVEVQGGYAFIEDLANGDWLSYNVQDPTNLQYLDWVSYSQGYDFVVSGDVLYIADGTLGLYLMNISDPANLGPNLGPSYHDGYNYTSVWVQGHTVYATANGTVSGNQGIFVYDASDLSSLVLIDHVGLTFPRDVVVYGDYMAVTDGVYGLYTYNVTDPFHITSVDYFDPNNFEAYGVDMYGTKVVMTQKYNGVYLMDATDIHDLQLIASYTSAGMPAHRVTVHDEFAFVANGNSIEIFQLFNTAANSFDTSPSTAQSLTFDSTTDIIVNATLTASTKSYPLTSIQWELTANGIDWEPIAVGVFHDFIDVGSDLHWRVTLDATYVDQSPYIYNITITYGYTAPPTVPSLTDPGTIIPPGDFWVNWTASTDPDGTIDFYQLQMSDSNTFTTILNEWIPTTPYQQVDALPMGTYYFRVRAFDNDGVPGPWSNIEDLTVQPVTGPPPIPGFPLEAIIFGAIVALSLGMIYRRKRQ